MTLTPHVPLRVWRKETVGGSAAWCDVYRAEIIRHGERLALVVLPVGAAAASGGMVWAAHVGEWRMPTLDVVEHGGLLTVEPTAERARQVASAWADGV
jgi:hypothetical protein